ncbi:uncharacterized protein F5891DRAFT_977312 [Suillus fuscotomentosus]|uniref:Uncharacterized protein n=1 Tax=Suillus fuscotomentosus TaxID=1912939 RepID=A0AAD4ECQ2_9AGAM|nr:uncharacterized protein F5891DRAFT_977312 [Suillus fuscotomentosus]KAG1903742.1 hypothetical protein F5891DRAFT_977312 [Suillus fuscotomentosus]
MFWVLWGNSNRYGESSVVYMEGNLAKNMSDMLRHILKTQISRENKAGLLSTVIVTFVIGMQSDLADTTSALLVQLIAITVNGSNQSLAASLCKTGSNGKLAQEDYFLEKLVPKKVSNFVHPCQLRFWCTIVYESGICHVLQDVIVMKKTSMSFVDKLIKSMVWEKATSTIFKKDVERCVGTSREERLSPDHYFYRIVEETIQNVIHCLTVLHYMVRSTLENFNKVVEEQRIQEIT